MQKNIYKIITLFILLFNSDMLLPGHRTLEISGLKIYKEKELVDLLNLHHYTNGRMPPRKVINSIKHFYKVRGYTIVNVSIIEKSKTSLKLYIDEGRLGKIIFRNIDDFLTLYLKTRFILDYKIFNVYEADRLIDKFKKQLGWRNMSYSLKPAKSYKKSFSQLDKDLKMPFMEKYDFKYDLIIRKSRKIDIYLINSIKKYETQKKTQVNTKKTKKPLINKVEYGIKIHYYQGFIPFLRYQHLGLFANADYLRADTSLGAMYGLDGRFKETPRITFFKFNTFYFFTPTFKDIFTPFIKLDFYKSSAARPDLGLASFNFLLLNALFAPGITLLSKWHLHLGVGSETIFFEDSKFDSGRIVSTDIMSFIGRDPLREMNNRKKLYRLYKEIEKRTDVYCYTEVGVAYDFTKRKSHELRKNRLKKEIVLLYNFYFIKKLFHQIRLIGYLEHEFKDGSIYSGKVSYNYVFNDPPFHHESSISSSRFFKGFNRKGYFSRNVLAQSNEYRISLFRDFIFVGAFFDMTLFESSGYDLKGIHFGFTGGLTVRLLLLDHFELYVYYGWDYMVTTGSNHDNVYFNIQNKW